MSKKFTELPDADALTGDEITAIVQGGQSKKTTLQEIADLATGGSGVEHYRGLWDASGDALPVDGDAWGSGAAGVLQYGDYGVISVAGTLTDINGTGDWGVGTRILYTELGWIIG